MKYILLIAVCIFYLIFAVVTKHKGILSESRVDTSLNVYFPFLILIIAVFFSYLLFSRRRLLRSLNGNLAITSKLLGAEIERPFFGLWFYQTIRGSYRNRKIILKVSLAAGKHDLFWRWMKLGGNYATFCTPLLNSKNSFSFFTKLITPNIFLKNNWLYYRGEFSNLIVNKDYTEEEVALILNELISQADRLDKGSNNLAY